MQKLLFKSFAVVLLFYQNYVTGYNAEIRKNAGVSDLLGDIVLKKFPKCGVVFVSDNHFNKFFLHWMEDLMFRPLHTINLEEKAHPMARGIAEDESSSGFANCTTIVICCKYKSTCRTENSQNLYNMLLASGIIRSTRRSFLYIQNETTNTFKPTSFYEKENTVSYSMPLMNDAVEILQELKSHITLIRRFTGTSPLLRNDDSPAYHLITFTPNWLPGGSPVLQIIWSKKSGFWEARGRSGGLAIKLKHIRPGNVRVALPNFHLLPLIDIADNGTATGLDASLMDMLTRKFKFKVKYFEVEDADFGKHLKGNKWTGVVGEVLQKNADIGMGPMLFNQERKETGIKFSPTLALLRGVVVCPVPPEIHPWLTLFTPFTLNVWIAIGVTIFCILALSHLLQRMMKRLFKPRKRWGEGWFPRRTKVRREVALTSLDCIGPLLIQSVPMESLSQRVGFRIFVGFLLLFGFALSTCYGVVLIGKLSIYKEKASYESLEDLIQNGKDWAISPLLQETLENTTDPDERKLMEGSIAIGEVRGTSADQAEYKYVLETGNCAVMEKAHAAYVIHNNYTIQHDNQPNRPLLRLSKGTFFLGPSGWVLRSDIDWILHKYLSNLFVTFRDRGFIDISDRMYERERDEFKSRALRDGDQEGIHSLEMETLEILFDFWMGGIILSIFTFISELSSFAVKELEGRKRKMKMKKQKKSK